MTQLIPVKYRLYTYPAGITPRIQEIAGHLDKTDIHPHLPCFSLHTEYSFGKRSLNSAQLEPYPELRQRQVNGVPQLWHSARWAKQFAEFLQTLCGKNVPTVIEIHPPFGDYTNLTHFFAVYITLSMADRFPSPPVRVDCSVSARFPLQSAFTDIL